MSRGFNLMKLHINKKLMVTVSIFSFFIVTSVIGFHCSKGFKGVIEEKLEVERIPSPDPDFNIMVDLPVGLMTPIEIFNSMRQSLQVVTPNSNTIGEFLSKQSTFPTEGQLYKVNSPMFLSLTNLSSQFCQQMISDEISLARNKRSFTNEINYGDIPININESQINDVVRRIARSAWGRNETDSELEIINSGMKEMIAELPSSYQMDKAYTEKMVLVLCATLLSSIDSVSL